MQQRLNLPAPMPMIQKLRRADIWCWSTACLSALAGLGWLALVLFAKPTMNTPQPTVVQQLQPGVVARMNSPAFTYSPGWHSDALGADPAEPADPWHTPAGVVTFRYTGAELALSLAVGDYWGYLYVTVDDQPANLLPVLSGNRNSLKQLAGYRTFYAPEQQTATEPTPQWVRVHRAASSTQEHQVRVEVWRGWGQTPLRAVAIDALPAPAYPRWPALALLLVAVWCAVLALPGTVLTALGTRYGAAWPLFQHTWFRQAAPYLALAGLLLLTTGVSLHQWLITLVGLLLLGGAALVRPVLWFGALLFALPFYYSFSLPLLPHRALSLIDVGVLGGLFVVGIHWLLTPKAGRIIGPAHILARRNLLLILLFAIGTWALISAFQAEQFGVALREWRTVFLLAGLFAWLLSLTLASAENRKADQWWLIGAWLAGGSVVALVGLWQYASGASLITAEGVWRVRAFYGSPNNLALYLDRTLAMTLALALFMRPLQLRLLWGTLAVIQAAALLLTFSKGALLLGLPALFATLWCGGLVLLAQRGESRRPLWWIAGTALLALVALTPFLGTARFQRLLDLRQGTGFLRLNLWQSAWQMALDHPLLGVGPDNFLYAFRSQYLLPAAWQEPNLNHPHNWLLDWWTRLGIPGLTLALAFFGLTIRQLWRNIHTTAEGALYVGLLAATITALAHGLIDASYALPDLMLVWALIAQCAFVADQPLARPPSAESS